MKKKTTIKDVAKAAGVSISTVSNALNDVDVLKSDTKAHILAVAKELNYVPNLNGRMLKSSKTKLLGFFSTGATGPYFNTLIESMSRECEELGYNLAIHVTQDKSMIFNQILGERFDGILLFEKSAFNNADIELLEQEKINTVFLDRGIEGTTMSSVIFDSLNAGYKITQHLIDLGHKKIAFIAGYPDAYDSLHRQHGFYKAMEDNQLDVPDNYLVEGLFDEKATYEAITRFIKEGNELPDAFVAANDSSAIGCMKALKDYGYQLPQDISVTGFDNIEVAQYFTPALTTMLNPVDEQGILAVQELIKLIDKEKTGEVIHIEVDGEIIIRESSIKKN